MYVTCMRGENLNLRTNHIPVTSGRIARASLETRLPSPTRICPQSKEMQIRALHEIMVVRNTVTSAPLLK